MENQQKQTYSTNLELFYVAKLTNILEANSAVIPLCNREPWKLKMFLWGGIGGRAQFAHTTWRKVWRQKEKKTYCKKSVSTMDQGTER